MLTPLYAAFVNFHEYLAQRTAERRAASARIRQQALEKAQAELLALKVEVTPLTVAAHILDFQLVVHATIPFQLKEKARRLKRDFPQYFASNPI
jgi:hypothetical protein